VGHPEKIRTLLDLSLREHGLLWAGAGDHHSMFSITYNQLRTVTQALELHVR
jgi:prolyl-tRNA editing enzyme YbaK/EbsC (Cys-tRNA(Pro) deacylase)